MKLSSRFAIDIALMTGGAFVVAAALAFSPPVAGWLGFGVSTGFAVLAMASLAVARSTSWRIGHGLAGLVALWSLSAALIFTGTTLTWLVLGDAIALAAVALADLMAHEVTTENVVHRLEVTGAPAPGQRAAA